MTKAISPRITLSPSDQRGCVSVSDGTWLSTQRVSAPDASISTSGRRISVSRPTRQFAAVASFGLRVPPVLAERRRTEMTDESIAIEMTADTLTGIGDMTGVTTAIAVGMDVAGSIGTGTDGFTKN